MEALIAVTYKCNAKCYMCNTWQFPSKSEEEITAQDIEKIPSSLKFANITGGEPFLRKDIEDVIAIVLKKTKRLVVSTNGYFTERIVDVAKKYPNIGVRVSIEGLPSSNDDLRGIKDGFDHGLRTLLKLHELGLKDIGFGITVSDRNAKDLNELYTLAEMMGLEFATATVHNSYYFHKFDNKIEDKEMVIQEFRKLEQRMLRSKNPKEWFRAYFNEGLVNYIRGNNRFLPCEMGTDVFFMDPFGNIKPCNGMDMSMGNIKEKTFDEIWNGEEAKEVREAVKNCTKNCWMVGSAAPAMKKSILLPIRWILRNKWRKEICD
ncbi:MAG: putative radical domain iron-sulfur cluster-binding oxidoreductase [Caloramator sp.]|jgi:MoaA/NifB/PqqE/SkfB family radical SAM enzyme|uniref:radical SAM protein n=1 Tax=Eubacteriales TaxID=186802 RepID=UPI000B99ADB0|nr:MULTISPECIES: radical SAM protein [Eubacteriales]MBZ4664628.1 putative radical domain iron-sulfur cluster-binding oxidoreductase [Caloramator sp.]